ncbi:MAG: transglycosylase SLT domain-containing protein [Candidatus Magasanikbacteria bacterium]
MPEGQPKGDQKFSRREVLLGAAGVFATALGLGGERPAEAAKKHPESRETLNEDFHDNVLDAEIERIASQLPEPKRKELLARKKNIFDKAEKRVMHTRLKGSGENEYFSTMLEKWHDRFPIIVKYCKDEDGKRNKDLEGVMTAILSGETAMKIPHVHKGAGYASGYYQIEKATAVSWGLTVNEKVDQRYDFEASTRAAAKALLSSYDKYGQWGLAMLVFGKGGGAVQTILQEGFGVKFPTKKQPTEEKLLEEKLLFKKNLLAKGVNAVSVCEKIVESKHTFIKETLGRHFHQQLESQRVSKK